MLRPVGNRYSANWYNVALMNYGRMVREPRIGRADTGVGIKLYCAVADGRLALEIDQRGPGLTRFHASFPFSTRLERRQAFALAMEICEVGLRTGRSI